MEFTIADVKQMTPAQINARWDEVSDVMERSGLVAKAAAATAALFVPPEVLTLQDVKQMTPTQIIARQNEVFALLEGQRGGTK